MEKAKLVKQGKPISYYRGVEPICHACRRVVTYATWECKHPDNKDLHEYKLPCTTLEWEICPLNPQRKSKRKMKVTIEVDFKCPYCGSEILYCLDEVCGLIECRECGKVFRDYEVKPQ